MNGEGYPSYAEIKNEKERRRKQEMEVGRQRTLKAMAEGLVERLKSDHKLKGEVTVVSDDPDPRQWVVRVDFVNAKGTYEENLWVFPSEEFIATNMLVAG